MVRRKDGLPAYHVASLTDDTDFKINLVVRGSDLLESTAAQLYLAQTIDNTTFPDTLFYHHPLIRDVDGRKLAKSAGSASVQSLMTALPAQNFISEFDKWRKAYLSQEP